jgi:hypothetical protein
LPTRRFGRNRPEQLLVDPERVHVHELQAVPLGEPPRLFHLGVALVGPEVGRIGRERRRRPGIRHRHRTSPLTTAPS